MLNVPYEEVMLARKAGARYFPTWGWAFSGKELPPPLRRYSPERYSWMEWIEGDLRGEHGQTRPAPAPDTTTGNITPRTDQLQDIRKIMVARKAGAPEVLVASDMGVGKTVVAISAVKRMANVRNVLVVCPNHVIAGWRLHLRNMGDGDKNWCLINYESTKKLLSAPPEVAGKRAGRAKNLAIVNKGIPRVQWDVVISDEAHMCSNPESQQTRTVDKVIAGPGLRSAFSLRLTGTPGKDPSKLSYLHRGFFWRDGLKPLPRMTPDRYVKWCEGHDLSVDRSGYGNALAWNGGDDELDRVNRIIFGGDPPWAFRRIPDWPEQQRIPFPVEITYDQRLAYESDWREFQAEMRGVQRKMNQGGAKARREAQTHGFAAQVRFRQKAGAIRAEGTADFVLALLERGKQVAISAEWHTTITPIVEALRRRGVDPALFTGRQEREEREADRIAYQRGEKKVIIYSVATGLNLHAGETAVGGNDVPRVTVVAEPSWSPAQSLQKEKRSQRNGTSAPVYYCFATETIEEKIIEVVIRGMGQMARVNGDETEPFSELASTLQVPFVLGDKI